MPVQEIKLKAASDAPSKSGLENVPPDQLESAMKAAMARSDGDLDLTEEEQNKFTKAFQDKEFRKMMAEYVDEIRTRSTAEKMLISERDGGRRRYDLGVPRAGLHAIDASSRDGSEVVSILGPFGPSRATATPHAETPKDKRVIHPSAGFVVKTKK